MSKGLKATFAHSKINSSKLKRDRERERKKEKE